MVIVDTSVWIDFLNQKLTPETAWLRGSRDGKSIGLTALILTEVLQGIRFDQRYLQAEAQFRTLQLFDGTSLQLALQSAQNYRSLRKSGITIRSTIDCLIATFCIAEGHQLLHRDSDFDYFEQRLGLSVVHP
jgi:predicted nucleic acid-binding protein